MQDLIAAKEVAELFGITRQRISQIREIMPAPVYESEGIRLWDRAEIVAWGERNGYIETY